MSQVIQKRVWKNKKSLQLLPLKLGWPRKLWKHLTTTVEYENPHESSTLDKYSHMMALWFIITHTWWELYRRLNPLILNKRLETLSGNVVDEEMVALDVNATWELVAILKDKKVIGCKWVYKVKHNVDGSMNRYKIRLVAKCYAQTYGIDYEETYSPFAKMTIIKVIIAMAVAKGCSLHQMDVKNVFLHGDL